MRITIRVVHGSETLQIKLCTQRNATYPTVTICTRVARGSPGECSAFLYASLPRGRSRPHTPYFRSHHGTNSLRGPEPLPRLELSGRSLHLRASRTVAGECSACDAFEACGELTEAARNARPGRALAGSLDGTDRPTAGASRRRTGRLPACLGEITRPIGRSSGVGIGDRQRSALAGTENEGEGSGATDSARDSSSARLIGRKLSDTRWLRASLSGRPDRCE